jgi:putative MATE family efflux protein
MAKDLTQGKPWKLIFLFALPIMAGNFLQQLYYTVDSAIVGNMISQNALSAVGTCAPLTMLFTALAIGFSTGAGIIVAQFYGAKQISEMRRAASTAILFVLGLGLLLSIVGVAAAYPLLKYALGVPETNGVLDMAATYFRFYAIGLVFQFGYNIFAAILRSIGDSKATLYFLLISSAINVVLDLLFVAVFHWGVAGAAVATTIAQLASCVAGYVYMTRKYEMFRFARSEFRFHGDKCRLILKVGVPTALQQCVVSCGHILVQRLVNSYGTDMMAAFTASQRLEQYILVPIISYQNGISMFVGQNTGAGQIERVKTGFHQTMLLSFLTCAVLSSIAFVFTPQLISIFGVTGAAYTYGCEYLRAMAPCFLIFAVYLVVLGMLQGAGDTKVAMLCTLLALTVRVIFSYLLAWHTPLSYRAIWWAMVIGWLCAAVIAFARYFSGKWKTKAII